MNKKGFAYSTFSLLFVFCLTILAVSLIYFQGHPNVNPEPLKNLTWYNVSPHPPNNNTIIYITYSFVNFLGDSMFRVAKDISNWAYVNQNIVSPKLLIYCIFLFLLTPVIYPVFLIITSLILIYKEYRNNKKEIWRLRIIEIKRDHEKYRKNKLK